MTEPFNPVSGLILVRAEIDGPTGIPLKLRLAHDTGANVTVVNPAILTSAGYDLASAFSSGTMTSADGVSTPKRLRLSGLRALGVEVPDLLVIAHQLPANVKFDGLLGLDFLRGRELTVDFRRGELRLI